MKRLLLLTIIGIFLCANDQKNAQLCLNTSPNFGTTHFIVGYKDTTSPAKDKNVISKKKLPNRAPQKGQHNGAALIDKDRNTQSFFTTIHDISDILLEIISQAQETLYIAAFTLTDKRIADLIIKKHQQGVEVVVIVDAGNMKQLYSKIPYLIKNNIRVLRYDPSLNPLCKKNGLHEPVMHHKCIVVDNKVVITGSANFTKAGQKSNIENINILRDPLAVKEHYEEFQRLKKYCTHCTS